MSDIVLSQYRELLRRTDEKFEDIRAANPTQFVCRLGCHSCCRSGITVNALEATALREYLRENPKLIERLRALAEENPHQGKRCELLGAGGNCVVYEARPLVCRSHGAPLQFRPLSGSAEENLRHRDVCPLNFTTRNISELPPQEVLNLDTLNTLLGLLLRTSELGEEETRIPLSVSALLNEK